MHQERDNITEYARFTESQIQISNDDEERRISKFGSRYANGELELDQETGTHCVFELVSGRLNGSNNQQRIVRGL